MDPDWSPDGQLIVFSRFAGYGASLYTVRPDGSGLTKITSEPSFATHPRWSPDAQLIAYEGYDDGSIADVYVVAPDRSQRRLFASGSVPSWSPDGRRIVYFSTPLLRRGAYGTGSEVWTDSADAKQRRRLARFGCCLAGVWAPPVWSPDGRQIAFSGTPNGGTLVVHADGSGRKRISRMTAAALSWQRVH
jgi:Tol biopolymer transport system component